MKRLGLWFLGVIVLTLAAVGVTHKAKAYDGCSSNTYGRYAHRTLLLGVVPAAYDSGATCKITVCVNTDKVASKLGPTCDGANPSCAANGFVSWAIGYEILEATAPPSEAPINFPTCDTYWNTASRWN